MKETISTAGDRAFLLEMTAPPEEIHGLAAAIRQRPESPAVIVGHSSVLVIAASPADAAAVRSYAERGDLSTSRIAGESRTLQVPVSIDPADAPDLDLLLERLGCTREEMARLLESLGLRARFAGFRPGFVYLDGVPPEMQMPRRSTSRTRIPGGSFAIAGDLAAFYPADSPGGWNLIGRTNLRLWDPTSDEPAMIRPGDEVRIHVVESLAEALPLPTWRLSPGGNTVATVLNPGQRTLIVGPSDLRRYDVGLPAGGFFDTPAAETSNRAAGNAPGACVLECARVGPTLRFEDDAVVAWAGAQPDLRINGVRIADFRQMHIRAGDVVQIGRLSGMRGYLAVSGGLVTPSDRYELEPWVLRAGELRRHDRRGGIARIRGLARDEPALLGVMAGPHDVPGAAVEEILKAEWTATNQGDRVGLRLESSSVVRGRDDQRSCGMQFGTVQFHPNGDLVIMGPDHPVTGGYTQIMTVISTDLWKVAQLVPGDRVRWRIHP